MIVESRCLLKSQPAVDVKLSPRDTVRNNEGSSAIAQGLEAFLDELFRLGINSTGSFIQKNDLRLL
jgi:hypothetical protein